MPPIYFIWLPMPNQVVCILHHPPTVVGLLPFPDGFSGKDIWIFYVTHGKGMECDLHTLSIRNLAVRSYEFGSHGKYPGYDLRTGASDVLMLSLGTIGTPKLDEMNPASQGAVHVEPALRVTFRQHATCLFLGYAIKDSPTVGFSSGSNDILLFFNP